MILPKRIDHRELNRIDTAYANKGNAVFFCFRKANLDSLGTNKRR